MILYFCLFLFYVMFMSCLFPPWCISKNAMQVATIIYPFGSSRVKLPAPKTCVAPRAIFALWNNTFNQPFLSTCCVLAPVLFQQLAQQILLQAFHIGSVNIPIPLKGTWNSDTSRGLLSVAQLVRGRGGIWALGVRLWSLYSQKIPHTVLLSPHLSI